MKRRKLLQSAGLLSVGSTAAVASAGELKLLDDVDEEDLQNDMSNKSTPTGKPSDGDIVLESEGKFKLIEDQSSVIKKNSKLKGTAVIKNVSGDSIEGVFKTYFIGTVDGSTYGTQGIVEVKEVPSGKSLKLESSLTVDDASFELKEFVIVLSRVL